MSEVSKVDIDALETKAEFNGIPHIFLQNSLETEWKSDRHPIGILQNFAKNQ